MAETFAILHISDTHLALSGERLSLPALAHRRLPVTGVVGAALRQIRRAVIAADAAQSAESPLQAALLQALTTTGQELVAAQHPSRGELDGAALIHTGDLTQAGQICSMQDAMELLSRSAGIPAFFQIGNHDAWPQDFPPFAAERVVLQHQWIRGLRSGSGNELPHTYPAINMLDVEGTIELIRLNSVLADSFPNTLALGSVAPELGTAVQAGHASDQFAQLSSRTPSTALRIVAMHHPPYPLNTGFWTSTWSRLMSPQPCGLLEGPVVQNQLLRNMVNLVLCGHEHSRSSQQIMAGGRILQLAVGSPSFRQTAGNHDVPHFSLYWFDIVDTKVVLWWMLCMLDVQVDARWSLQAVFELNRTTGIWTTRVPPVNVPVPLANLLMRP